MTYRITFKEPIQDVSEPKWFANSYTSIADWDDMDILDSDKAYEKKFNVKLVYYSEDDPQDNRVCAIEFQDAEHATAFMLRWA